MATAPEEMEDLSKVTGALLVNFGTIQSLAGMLAAGMSTGSTFLYGTLLPSIIYSLARFGYFWGNSIIDMTGWSLCLVVL